MEMMVSTYKGYSISLNVCAKAAKRQFFMLMLNIHLNTLMAAAFKYDHISYIRLEKLLKVHSVTAGPFVCQ